MQCDMGFGFPSGIRQQQQQLEKLFRVLRQDHCKLLEEEGNVGKNHFQTGDHGLLI